MSNWNTNPEWNDPSEFNDGNEYQLRDGVKTTDMNKIVENVIYLFNHMPLDPTIPLDTPEISLSGNTLTITEVEGATKYGIYADGILKHTVMSSGSMILTYDLSLLNIYPGTYDIQVKAKGRGYKDSAFSNTVVYTRANMPYIVFRSLYSFNVWISVPTYEDDDITYPERATWDGLLEYSTDGVTWHELDYETAYYGVSAVRTGDTYQLFFRGTGNTKLIDGTSSTGDATGGWKVSGTEVYCSGNVENLFDYATVTNGQHITDIADRAMYGLFADNSSLVQAPEVLFTKTTTNMCSYMFANSAIRTSPSILPSFDIAYGCYSNMFKGCASMTTAPELPATMLSESCYYHMFEGCSSLIEAPDLPATILAQSCYYYMFSGCSSLETAAAMPNDITIVGSCCYCMYYYCTSLKNLPDLSHIVIAGTMACYEMFQYCSNVKVSETQSEEYPYEYIIPAQATNYFQMYGYMFERTGGTYTGGATKDGKTLYSAYPLVPSL